jgi:acetyltransferase-like isoleucine patch superfamily enzyme
LKATAKDKVMNSLFKFQLPFFSLFVLCLSLYFLGVAYKLSSATYLIFAFLTPYLIPLLTWRLINFIYPLKEGSCEYLAEKTFSPWLSSYRIQEIYLKLPILEGLIHFVPFLYNSWLKAWGSEIGKRVLIPPSVKIVDRTSLKIGNNVYLGDEVYFSSHFIVQKNGRIFCYHKSVTIEDNCFIGAFTKLGPGACVKANSKVKAFSYFSMNSSVPGNFSD